MPRIFDNIELKLLPILQETLKDAKRADFCVGYFSLHGWQSINSYIENLPDDNQECCQLIVIQKTAIAISQGNLAEFCQRCHTRTLFIRLRSARRLHSPKRY